jgi:HlyD family secretion protein
MKKFLIVAVILLLIVGGGYAARQAGQKSAGQDGATGAGAGAVERTVTVRRGSIAVVINATGKVIADQVVEVKSKAGGEVVGVFAELGDRVEKGQLLVELDPSDEERSVTIVEAQLRQQQARLASARSGLELARSTHRSSLETTSSDLESAQAALDEAKRRYERQRDLFNQGGSISAQELDTARAASIQAEATLSSAKARAADAQQQKYVIEQREQDINQAEAELSILQVQLDQSKERLSETRIVAPISGVLTEKLVEVGQVISSALSNVGGGTTLLKVSDVGRLYIEASVDEVDIGQISPDQRAIVTADAFPAEQFVGRVERVAPVGENVNNVVVFNVQLEISGTGLESLKPGMTVNVAIEAGVRDNALLLPVQAIYYEGDQAYVLRDDNPSEEKATRVYFAGGLTDGLTIEVLDGLVEGEVLKVKGVADNARWRNDG